MERYAIRLDDSEDLRGERVVDTNSSQEQFVYFHPRANEMALDASVASRHAVRPIPMPGAPLKFKHHFRGLARFVLSVRPDVRKNGISDR